MESSVLIPRQQTKTEYPNLTTVLTHPLPQVGNLTS